MTRLFLVRHAESIWNPIKRLQGIQDPPLSDKGKQQAELVGQRFQSIRPDALYSSHMTRALQTAERIARTTGLSPLVEPGLHELSFGEWEGILITELDLDGYRNFLEYWAHRARSQPVPGAEPLDLCRDRIVGAISRIIQRHPEGSVAVVSHGSALGIFFQHVLESPVDNMWRMQPSNCSISLVNATDKGLRIIFYNDICHLEDRS